MHMSCHIATITSTVGNRLGQFVLEIIRSMVLRCRDLLRSLPELLEKFAAVLGVNFNFICKAIKLAR